MTITTKWIKTGDVHDFVFIGKEVIATVSGNYIIFYNLITKEERIEYFNSPMRGYGVCCLAGHSVIPIFSTVERCYHPKIYIHTYPSIEKIAECKLKNDPCSYISCCFIRTEYIVSLTSFENFQLIVWFWKTGEKIAIVDTLVKDQMQLIESSTNSTHLLYQFSINSGKLLTYEIYGYNKKAAIVKNSLKLIEYKIVCVSWMNNDNLLLCDNFQNVFIVSYDGIKIQKIICKNQQVDINNKCFTVPINDGFVLLDNALQLSFYQKSTFENNLEEIWNMFSSVKLEFQPLKIIMTRHKDAILLHSKCGKIFELCLINGQTSEINEILNTCRKFKFICLLNPQQLHAVVIDSLNCLLIISLFDGYINAKFQINKHDEVISIDTHPNIPFISIITSSGKCICFTTTIEHLKIVKIIHLQKQPLYKIKFSKNGELLGIVSEKPSIIFFLKTVVNEGIEVMSHINLENSVVDFLIFSHKKSLQVIILAKTCLRILVGDVIEIYSIDKMNNLITKNYKVYTIICYQNLCYGMENFNNFIGLPYLSKQIHFFKIENTSESIILMNSINSEHNLKKININISNNYILTSGFDGLIILKENHDLKKSHINFMVHHYQDKGTKYSIYSITSKRIVCLGSNGSLVGLQFGTLEEINWNRKIKELEWSCADNSRFLLNDNLTWLEKIKIMDIRNEEKVSLPLKNALLIDMKKIKDKINELLNLNENLSFESQLPISAFDLNVTKRTETMDKYLYAQEKIKVALHEEMNQIEKVTSFVIKKFCNRLKTENCVITSFNEKTIVSNFSFNDVDESEKINDFFIELFDTPLSNIRTEFISKQETPLDTISPTVENAFDPRPEKSQDMCFFDYSDDTVLSGSTSFKWLKDNFPKNQLMKFINNPISSKLIESREYKLKMLFNRKFDKIRNSKDKLLKVNINRIEKLNNFKNQMKSLFKVVLDDDNEFQNIKCQLIMIPESNENISSSYVKNNICSNKQIENTSNTSNYEFSFREEKLNEMMDGLLEIRMQDKVSKDIIKPHCLIFKSPSKYDCEDIKAIETYSKEVEELEIERQKYKAYLMSEIHHLRHEIKNDIIMFNKQMKDFAMEKIRIRSAILQEFLLRLREEKRQCSKSHTDNKILLLENGDLAYLENTIKTITIEILDADASISELQSKYENLNKRDKEFEEKFQSEFYDIKKPKMEYLLKQYKRRPRLDKFNYTSITCLTEMNKCLLTGKQCEILPQDYLNFLRFIDTIDMVPINLRSNFDTAICESFCKFLRNKIDLEIKSRIAYIELRTAEDSYAVLQKRYSMIQNKIFSIKNTIEEEKLQYSRSINNPEIQLVLKSGQVEINTTGCVSDFYNSTIVTYKHITETNQNIIKAGKKKVIALRKRLTLKKSLLIREWNHRCISQQIKHLKEYLIIIRNTKICKNVQNYINEKAEKRNVHKHSASCDKILKSNEKKFQRMLEEKKTAFQQIVAEIKFWRKINADFTKKIEQLSLEKLKQTSNIEKNNLLKKNIIFKKTFLDLILERKKLVTRIKDNHDQIHNLRNQLEILKYKTYPTLQFKNNVYYSTSYY